MSQVDTKKRRGRKKRSDDGTDDSSAVVMPATTVADASSPQPTVEVEEKKKGRKSRGSKVTTLQINTPASAPPIANIILHLKCSTNDLHEYNNKQIVKDDPYEYIPDVPSNVIMTYNGDVDTPHYGIYESSTIKTASAYPENTQTIQTRDQNTHGQPASSANAPTSASQIHNAFCTNCAESSSNEDNLYMRDINAKLKRLKVQLYKNAIPDKKASCFWCTYDFDNQACYIPKYEMDGTIHGYGSFCRPECAVAYLMRENIDDSTKFERYHLLNQIYSKIYGFKKNIKPAPNPYYMLEKYYGNLSIQEYRKLLKTEHMMLVIDKPMTRILPELHDDNDDLIGSIYGSRHVGTAGAGLSSSTSGIYKVKRQGDKTETPSKSSIMKNKFGIA